MDTRMQIQRTCWLGRFPALLSLARVRAAELLGSHCKMRSEDSNNRLSLGNLVRALVGLLLSSVSAQASTSWDAGTAGCFTSFQTAMAKVCAINNPDSTSIPGYVYYRDSCVAGSIPSFTVSAHVVTPAGESFGFTYTSSLTQCDLTISLSGGTEVEPSIGSDLKPLPIIATVIDKSTKQPPTNPVKVNVSLKVEDSKSGGHAHGDGTRPRGGIAEVETCASDAECWPSPQSTDGKGMTDSKGMVVFNFNAPEASGTHTISATCDGCSNTASKPVNVRVDGLKPIPAIPFFYALNEANGDVIGAWTGWHTDNHNLTHDAAQKLMQIASLYRLLPQFKVVIDKSTGKKGYPLVLHLNDASLPWGGVYDICARPGACEKRGIIVWKEPHKGHRRGTVIDVRANGAVGSIPTANKIKFINFLIERGVPYIQEDQKTSNEHFHLMLLGTQE